LIRMVVALHSSCPCSLPPFLPSLPLSSRFSQYVLSLAHVVGRSSVIAPRQLFATLRCLQRWFNSTGGTQKQRCTNRLQSCFCREGPIGKLRQLASLQKGNLATRRLRSQLVNEIGFTVFQSDRIVTQMQHWDRLQERRKVEKLEHLLVGQRAWKIPQRRHHGRGRSDTRSSSRVSSPDADATSARASAESIAASVERDGAVRRGRPASISTKRASV